MKFYRSSYIKHNGISSLPSNYSKQLLFLILYTSCYRGCLSKIKKCINDMKTRDLSGCGSVHYFVKEYLPLASILVNYACTGETMFNEVFQVFQKNYRTLI